jgi:hypothetical protein
MVMLASMKWLFGLMPPCRYVAPVRSPTLTALMTGR